MSRDFKQIFKDYQKKYHLCHWLDKNEQVASNEGEVFWQYCGLTDDFKEELVNAVIETFFKDKEYLYLCISPSKTDLINKELVAGRIAEQLHKKDIGITDESFDKMIHFTSYGVYKKGINQGFDKVRKRSDNQSLQVSFFTNVIEEKTKLIPSYLNEYLRLIEKDLYKNYGGTMESLWIDIELVEKQEPYPFRFQKRVNSPSSYTDPYTYNVGHFSIKPDFNLLDKLQSKSLICLYLIDLLCESINELSNRKKALGDFDFSTFQSDFIEACEKVKSILK
ncbi:hypothetical protein SAMN04488018_106175 [Myroides marinus]|uniref:Uncharacterized protein n=1 Tax=Myroides marinus TaxID=703342 RepID=A0A1H6UEG5_9FLAO|nr:hypothetical protein [Myroides marinus]SEI90016.1 hypothetical protein SAMN04488018_106175 [Myroides marinus]